MKPKLFLLTILSLLLLFISCGKSKKELEAEKNYNQFMNNIDKLPKYEVRKEVCPDCRGTGKLKCKKCNGTGRMDDPKRLGVPIDPVEREEAKIDCDECDGYGFFVCPNCGGNGVITKEIIK